jgi:hypothetical protein
MIDGRAVLPRRPKEKADRQVSPTKYFENQNES